MKTKRSLLVALVAILFVGSAFADFQVHYDQPDGTTTVVPSNQGYVSLADALVIAIANDETGIVRICGKKITEPLQLDRGITTKKDGCIVELSASTVLIAAPKTNGFIEWTRGDRVGLRGPGKILVDRAISNQTIVSFIDCVEPIIDGVTVEVSTGDATASDSITVFSVTRALSPRVTNNTVHPNAGVRCWYYEDGSKGVFSGNYAGPMDDGGQGSAVDFPPYGAEYTARECWRVLQMVGYEYFSASDNAFIGLGVHEESKFLEYVVSWEHSGDDSEQGHWQIRDTLIEHCDAPNQMILRGAAFCKLGGVMFGATPTPDEWNPALSETDCVLLVEATAGGTPITELDIDSCDFHNSQHAEDQISIADGDTGVAVSGGSTLTSAGGWEATPGLDQWIEVSGFTGVNTDNNGWYRVIFSSGTIAIVDGGGLTNTAAGNPVTIEQTPGNGAPSIAIQDVLRGVRIRNCGFKLTEAGPTIIVDGDTSNLIDILGCTFEGSGSRPPNSTLKISGTGTVNAINQLSYSGNSSEGYLAPFTIPVGAQGRLMVKGLDYEAKYTGWIQLQGFATSAGSLPRILDAESTGLFSAVEVGDFVSVTGSETAAGNNGFMLVDAVDGSGHYIDVRQQIPFLDFTDDDIETGPHGSGMAFSGTTITRDSDSFITDGFEVGMTVSIMLAEDSANNSSRTVQTVTATVLTLKGVVFTTNADDTTAIVANTSIEVELHPGGDANLHLLRTN